MISLRLIRRVSFLRRLVILRLAYSVHLLVIHTPVGPCVPIMQLCIFFYKLLCTIYWVILQYLLRLLLLNYLEQHQVLELFFVGV